MESYQVIVKGHIDKRRFRGMKELELDYTLSGETKLICRQFDQSALHALLTKICDLGLQLIEIKQINCD